MNRQSKASPSRGRCVDLTVGARVYDYYNGALEAGEVREFEQHLVRCSHCEMTIVQLDEMMLLLGEESDFDPLPGEIVRQSRTGSLVKLGV
jgi:hypothetical protein